MVPRSPKGSEDKAVEPNMSQNKEKNDEVVSKDAEENVPKPIGFLGHLTRASNKLEALVEGGDAENAHGALKEAEDKLEAFKDECNRLMPQDPDKAKEWNQWMRRHLSQKEDIIHGARVWLYKMQERAQEEIHANDSASRVSRRSRRSTTSETASAMMARAEAMAAERALELERQHQEEQEAIEEEERRLAKKRKEADLNLRLAQARARREALDEVAQSVVSSRSGNRGERRRETSSAVIGVEQLCNQMANIQARSMLPRVQLKPFKGDLTEFQWFMRSFEMQVERYTNNDQDRLQLLLQYLEGPPHSLVKGCLMFEASVGFSEAKKMLKKKYGNLFRISLAVQEKLLAWPAIRADSAEDMEKFATKLKECLDMKNATGMSDLDTAQYLSKLMLKLPAKMQDGWRKTVVRKEQANNRSVGFKDFYNFVNENSEALNHPVFGKAVVTSPSAQSSKSNPNNVAKGRNVALATSTEDSPSSKVSAESCRLCKGAHKLEECPNAANISFVEKRNKLKGLCFGCLQEGHLSKNCEKRAQCKICGKEHPTVLHIEKKTSSKDEKKSGEGAETARKEANLCAAMGGQESKVAVTIVPVRVWGDPKRGPVLTNAVLDNGSTAVFITASLTQKLGLKGEKGTISLSTMDRKDHEIPSEVVSGLRVEALDKSHCLILPPALTRPSLPLDKSDIPTPEEIAKWSHLRDLPIEFLDEDVGLLIGANVPAAVRPIALRPGKDDEPYASQTKLGWAISGPLGASLQPSKALANYVKARECDLLQKIYYQDLEDAYKTHEKGPSADDRQWLKIVESSVRQKADGRYEIALPFRSKDVTMPDNRKQAESRLQCLGRRFRRDESFKAEYCKFVDNMLSKGYAEEAPSQVSKNGAYYVPHHGVFHPQKKKLRVVFDCSCEYQGRSLNGELMHGPDLANDLIGVLTRFRQEKVAFCGDVESMFYRVSVPEEDRDYLRFLWWPSGEPSREPTELRLTVHLFGATSSPSCANFALQKTARDHPASALAKSTVLKNFYVDDCLKSVRTIKEAQKLIAELKDLCWKGGFRLTKFVARPEVLETVPKEDLGKSVSVEFSSDKVNDGPIEGALGVHWNVNGDYFQVRTAMQERPKTKRGVLGALSSVFDPLGMVAPAILPARLVFRKLTSSKLGWDDVISKETPEWQQWLTEVPSLARLQIDRCFKTGLFGDDILAQLHLFADASTDGLAAVCYLRAEDKNGCVNVSFVAGKTRVAPPKAMTVPRLELAAAKMAAEMESYFRKELEFDLQESLFWSDSQTVLRYIRNRSKRFHVFVANRIAAIHEVSRPEQWHYVPTKLNPADEGSRGMMPARFVSDGIWLRGPAFLRKTQSEWPQEQPEQQEVDESDPEVKKDVGACLAKVESEPSFVSAWMGRHSSWFRARRAMAQLRRCCQRFKGQKGASSALEPISVEELKSAERLIIKLEQEESFFQELEALKVGKCVSSASRICDLDVHLKNGIIVLHSRAGIADRPVLTSDGVARLLVIKAHEKMGHLGREATLAELRRRYWIVGANLLVRRVVKKCIHCQKLRAPRGSQKMADLPEDRISECVPFQRTGVDYFGPFFVQRGRGTIKMYGAIFTCLAMRAVHLEVAESLSTDSFINALRRFVARRGHVELIRCDNGTNFKGAQSELKEELEALDQQQCHTELARRGIEWKLNTPSASHHGGVWERMIRTVRQILTMMLQGARTLTYEGLVTFLCEIEFIVNSRPLTPTSEDAADLLALSPNDLLLNKRGLDFAPGLATEGQLYRKQWKRVQSQAEEFWNRWRKEYLTLLRTDKKWLKLKPDIKEGTVVLMVNDNEPRSQWSLARIVKSIQGSDGAVRTVQLRTGTGQDLIRPITKICPLELDN